MSSKSVLLHLSYNFCFILIRPDDFRYDYILKEGLYIIQKFLKHWEVSKDAWNI